MTRILVAADDGLRTFDEHGSPGPVDHEGRSVVAVAPDRDDLWAVVDGTEVWRTLRAGEWTHAADLPGHAATCIAFTDALHVGTSEARLFRLAGDVFRPVESFDAVDQRG